MFNTCYQEFSTHTRTGSPFNTRFQHRPNALLRKDGTNLTTPFQMMHQQSASSVDLDSNHPMFQGLNHMADPLDTQPQHPPQQSISNASSASFSASVSSANTALTSSRSHESIVFTANNGSNINKATRHSHKRTASQRLSMTLPSPKNPHSTARHALQRSGSYSHNTSSHTSKNPSNASVDIGMNFFNGVSEDVNDNNNDHKIQNNPLQGMATEWESSDSINNNNIKSSKPMSPPLPAPQRGPLALHRDNTPHPWLEALEAQQRAKKQAKMMAARSASERGLHNHHTHNGKHMRSKTSKKANINNNNDATKAFHKSGTISDDKSLGKRGRADTAGNQKYDNFTNYQANTPVSHQSQWLGINNPFNSQGKARESIEIAIIPDDVVADAQNMADLRHLHHHIHDDSQEECKSDDDDGINNESPKQSRESGLMTKLRILSDELKVQPFWKLLLQFDWDKRGHIASGGESSVFLVIKKSGVYDSHGKSTGMKISSSQVYAIKETAYQHRPFAANSSKMTRITQQKIIYENRLLHIYGGIKTYGIFHEYNKQSGHGSFYFAQDLVDVSLKDVIFARSSPLKNFSFCAREGICRSYVHSMLMKLMVMHRDGLIHGDLKSDNVLIKKRISGGQCSVDDDVCLIDFGLSKQCEYGKSLSLDVHDFFGTLGYTAPEMYKYKQKRVFDHSIDIWAVGIIASEMILRRNLTRIDNINENAVYLQNKNGKYKNSSLFDLKIRLYNKHMKSVNVQTEIAQRIKWQPNMLHVPGVSDQCVDFVKQCLEYDPKMRITAENALMHPWFDEITSAVSSNE